ncbi:hypothetical protein GLAREA_09528 [Glarea lozoyensis ATCC 20868]|uniref:Uncharacterized protein n=1 Tax=Glarea lozoyensis (strain ATCC 20868 / MF5171) TaxID=1116229 RepID=S3DPM7_GLAL2|nr:uncharacterized protein GLAREA_09528 [Glarea lozoyensis ATCC 20868]EPE28408.1 hypothetical protein GLAREA_09528 [Glarea lozoyensis ATCC 20868]
MLQPADPTAPRAQLVAMPQLAEARCRDDNWTGAKDAAARRRAQTRLNTRAYRKRKALAAPGTSNKSKVFVGCWDNDQQSMTIVPASHAKQTYDPKNPLVPDKRTKQFEIVFPLCLDHLITLLQFNALRALIVNHTLVSGIYTTPVDCGEEVIHITPYPVNPGRFPPTLLPTHLQQTVPHGNWIDIFPSAEGRDRLIEAAGTFDEDELWMDCIGGLYEGFPDDEIERRGIVAWSPPWDISGWEMSEGFVKKWGWLVDGLPGILEATNRWRESRGEEPFPQDSCTVYGAE